MSRCIKHIGTLKKKLGQTVKVCTIEGEIGICKVTIGGHDEILLVTDDDSLGMSEFFWKTQVRDGKYGHWVTTPKHITEELKWITSNTSSKSTTKTKKKKHIEPILEPKSVEELWDKAPCKVRLCDGQVAYADTEGRPNHVVLVFSEKCDNGSGLRGWSQGNGKYGWYVKDTYDFEQVFVKKDEKPTKYDAFRPLNIEQLKENIPCHVLLKDGQIGYVDYERGTPTVYFNDEIDGEYGWKTDAEGFKYGWHIHDEDDFEDVFEVFESKEVSPEETVEPSLQEVLKEILETLKEIKNEVAKR